ENKILKEDVEKIVKGDDDSSGSEFADTMLLNDDDSDDDDNDDDDDYADHSLIRTQKTGSLKIMTEKMQTPIPSPPISIRIDLSSDKAITEESTVSNTPMSDVPSQNLNQPTSSRRTHLQGVTTRMCKRQVNEALKEIVPKLATSATNYLIKDNLLRIVNAFKAKYEKSSASTDSCRITSSSSKTGISTHAPKSYCGCSDDDVLDSLAGYFDEEPLADFELLDVFCLFSLFSPS
nr:hypothetical protein [Tanacetum cinerariifolium]